LLFIIIYSYYDILHYCIVFFLPGISFVSFPVPCSRVGRPSTSATMRCPSHWRAHPPRRCRTGPSLTGTSACCMSCERALVTWSFIRLFCTYDFFGLFNDFLPLSLPCYFSFCFSVCFSISSSIERLGRPALLALATRRLLAHSPRSQRHRHSLLLVVTRRTTPR
jgi:hypothetical protein